MLFAGGHTLGSGVLHAHAPTPTGPISLAYGGSPRPPNREAATRLVFGGVDASRVVGTPFGGDYWRPGTQR